MVPARLMAQELYPQRRISLRLHRLSRFPHDPICRLTAASDCDVGGREAALRELFTGGTLNGLEITYDPVKNATNVAAGRPSFDEVARFDFLTAEIAIDRRRDYGEERFQARGFLADRLHVLIFVETVTGIRVISFRKANKRERKEYEEATRTR